MAENNKNAMAGSAPAKPKPAAPVAAKPAAPGTAKPAASTGGVYKPPVERAASNPYKDSRVSDLSAWFTERFYVVLPIIDYLKKKEVPKHRLSFWYYFGGLALFFFIIQILTGWLLLQ